MYFEKDCFVIVDVKLCDDVKCAHGGTCKDTMSGFKCTCASGYKGLKCEEGRFLTKQVTHNTFAGIMYNADWVVYKYFSRNNCVICMLDASCRLSVLIY